MTTQSMILSTKFFLNKPQYIAVKIQITIDENIFNVDTIDEEFYDFIMNHKLTNARKYLLERNFNYDEIFRALFDNLIPKLEKKYQAEAIKIISEHMYKNAFVVDKEINCSAMLLYLMELSPKNGK